MDFDGGVTAAYQYADDDRVDPELTVSADLFVTLTRPKGEWLVYFEASTTPDADGISAFYPTANADAGSVLNEDGDGGAQVSEFNYTFLLENDKTLMLGLIDPSAWLDRSRITNDENTHFINGSFVHNSTIEFPDYTLGGIFRRTGSVTRPELTVVVASSEGIADLPDRSYQDLLSLTSSGRGAFVGVGAGWMHERRSMRLGAWLRTDDHTVAGDPDSSEANYGGYAVFGWQGSADAVNLRLGLANENVSVATRFIAIAYERRTRFGLFGAGVARTVVANSFRRADLHDVSDAEIFFRVPIGNGNAHLTPSVQYVENPGFDTSGSVTGSSALVASLRFHWPL